MDAAKEAMAKSKVIRREIAEATDHTHRMQVAAHAAVNEGLTRKLAQTVTLTVSIFTCIVLVLPIATAYNTCSRGRMHVYF